MFVNSAFSLFSLHKIKTKVAEENIKKHHVQSCLNWNRLTSYDLIWEKVSMEATFTD